MKIDLRYVLIVAVGLVGTIAPIYIGVGIGLSLGWSIEEVRSPSMLLAWPGVIGTIAALAHFGPTYLKTTKPIWIQLWKAESEE